jgi:maltooligosyltrehalose trehalohydrolase
VQSLFSKTIPMPEVDIHRRQIGINFNGIGAHIKVWSPFARSVKIICASVEKEITLQKDVEGYWTADTKDLQPGLSYLLQVDDKKTLPDPASVYQSTGVHGPSVAVDLAQFSWTDAGWKNPSFDNYIIYELHCGTFTESGTFAEIETKLDHLYDLGVTAIEIMPVSQFPGDRNWGYDGVYPFAVQNSYGGPEGLMRLVDACHSKGIAVVLDVVYNHLGPEGNYLGEFGPYFTNKYKTPWGNAINFDDEWCDGVRHYFIENALMWFRDFHIDALRLDAVHAIKDFSAVHILSEIRSYVHALASSTGRNYHLVVESDLNDPKFINPKKVGGFGMDAQWIDEFHHALRVTAGEEPAGYYSDFNGIAHLAKAYNDAYVYDGQYSPHRKRRFGSPASNEGDQFVVFSQNHDQVGNRMLGERTTQLVSFEMQKLFAAAVILSPFVPMLFMGEEWGETNPFLYFVSHTDPALADAVRKGRKEEFAYFFNGKTEAPDPMSENTFWRSKLQWQLLRKEPHSIVFNYYQELIQLRKRYPCFSKLERKMVRADADEENKILTIHRKGNPSAICVMNFSAVHKDRVWDEEGIWSTILCSADKEWMGSTSLSSRSLSKGQAISFPPESILVCLNV